MTRWRLGARWCRCAAPCPAAACVSRRALPAWAASTHSTWTPSWTLCSAVASGSAPTPCATSLCSSWLSTATSPTSSPASRCSSTPSQISNRPSKADGRLCKSVDFWKPPITPFSASGNLHPIHHMQSCVLGTWKATLTRPHK